MQTHWQGTCMKNKMRTLPPHSDNIQSQLMELWTTLFNILSYPDSSILSLTHKWVVVWRNPELIASQTSWILMHVLHADILSWAIIGMPWLLPCLSPNDASLRSNTNHATTNWQMFVLYLGWNRHLHFVHLFSLHDSCVQESCFVQYCSKKGVRVRERGNITIIGDPMLVSTGSKTGRCLDGRPVHSSNNWLDIHRTYVRVVSTECLAQQIIRPFKKASTDLQMDNSHHNKQYIMDTLLHNM
jgi:hypothetical protein